MSSNFSANQFESTFSPKRLQNWCVTGKPKPKRPTAQKGHTSFIVDERGHLLPGVKKGSVYPDFKGTWDQPCHLPANINFTARSAEGMRRLKKWGLCPDKNEAKSPSVKETSEPNVNEEMRVDGQRDALSSAYKKLATSPDCIAHNTSPVLEPGV